MRNCSSSEAEVHLVVAWAAWEAWAPWRVAMMTLEGASATCLVLGRVPTWVALVRVDPWEVHLSTHSLTSFLAWLQMQAWHYAMCQQGLRVVSPQNSFV